MDHANKPKQKPTKAKATDKSPFSEDDDLDDSDETYGQRKKQPKKSQGKKKPKKNHDDAQNDHGDDDYFEEGFNSDSDSGDKRALTEDDYALRDMVFSLYNTFPLEELQTLIATLPKRLKTAVSMRPFKDYEDMVSRSQLMSHSMTTGQTNAWVSI